MKKRMIILNIVIIAALFVGVVFASVNNGSNIKDAAKNKFDIVIDNLNNVTFDHFDNSQRGAREIANYINGNDMNITQALDYIKQLKFQDTYLVSIIFVDSLTGYSMVPNEQSGQMAIDMNTEENTSIRQFIRNISLAPDNSIKVSPSFYSPVTGNEVIAFCEKINIKDEKGQKRSALVMRTETKESIEKLWRVPEEFEEAEVSLITNKGDAILVSDGTEKGAYDKFSESTYELNKMLDESKENSVSLENLKKNSDVTYYGTYGNLGSSNNIIMVSVIPEKILYESFSFNGATRNATITILVCVVVGVMMLADIIYVMRLNRKFQQKALEAEEANVAKTNFLSSMSHDIKTPLNAIIGMSNIAMRNAGKEQVVIDSLKKVNRASNHLLTLINDILDISKIETGRLILNPAEFSISDAMENVVSLAQSTIKDKNLSLRANAHDIIQEWMFADGLRVNQIFINVLSNAVKYTEPGKEITIEVYQEEIENVNNKVRLVYIVKDEGIGMSEEFQKELYKPFSRAEDNRVKIVQGSGLGLAITKEMVALMGGTIECESKEGIGTTFTVKLELPRLVKLNVKEEINEGKVLLVDDDIDTLVSTSAMLRELGVEVVCVKSGGEALRLFEEIGRIERHFTALILDIRLSDMSGLEIASRVRQEFNSEVPILIATAYDWSDFEKEAREIGISGYISKPIFKATLYRRLKKIIENKSYRANMEEEVLAGVKGLNIIVAEDNDINWEIVDNILDYAQVKAYHVENGREAVRIIEESMDKEYNLILMDVQMPEMSGIEATRRIRKSERPYVRNIPIIAMTAYDSGEDVEECLRAGMNEHIAKPINSSELLVKIRDYAKR